MYLSERYHSGLFPRGGAIPPERRAVHITDMRTFLQCRRRWDFESLLRQGLQPALLPAPLFLGQGVHIGLDHGYRACLESDHGSMIFDSAKAIKVFRRWAKRRIAQLEEHAGALWEDEATTFNELIELGTVMLTHYGLWSQKVDGAFQVLGLERRFSVSVPGSMQVDYEGRFDGLIRHIKSGELYVLEFKTSAYMTDNKLSMVFRDMQSTAYHWAASQEYKQRIAGVLYRVLWKKIPDMPSMTSRGSFSRDKRQHLTEEWLDRCLDVMACQWDGDEDTIPAEVANTRRSELERDAYDLRMMIREKGEPFFIQRLIRRSQQQQEQMLHVLREIGSEMVGRPAVFPMAGAHCAWCRFKDVCDLQQQGYDELAKDMLLAEYAARTYWEDYDEE